MIQSGHLGNLVESPFDGDEMNMHMGQNILAETELRLLASTTSQIVSPSSNVPIISIYQDSLLGSYRISREGVKFTARDAMNLLMAYPNVNPATLFARSRKEVTNFEVLSQIMPPLTLKYKTKLWDADKKEDPATSNNYLEIYNGRYIRGQIEKSVLGGGSKGILHRICNDYGKKAGADFIDNLQNIVTEYMKVSSYSVGVSDLMSNRETHTRIIQAIQDKELEVAALIQKLHAGAFENNTSYTNKTEFEAQVNNVLNDATKKTDEISRQSLNPDNRFLMIVNSGSKGSLLNISHMISCLGQVNVDSKRVPYGFDSRTLPHFCKFDDSPGARGFIKNSYIGGLNAHELFFHAMGGRIGLIDTAVKTSQTGYIQRRLIKGLEDLKVEYDLTVRNSNGKVIQFSYGEDAFDPMFVENQSLPIVAMSTQDIYMHYDMVTTDKTDGDVKSVFNKSASARMGKQKAELQKTCKKYVDMMMEARDMAVKNIFKNKNVDSVLAPVAFTHIINNIQGNLGLAANSIVDVTPLEAFQLIEEYYAKLNALHYAKPNPLFETLYFYYLNPRELLLVKRFHRKGLIMLLETVFLKYKQAIVNPGEMVGVVAGQSIGEPTTQLTLNSFVYETEILVRDDKGVVSSFQIGDFAKWGIETTSKMEYMADKDTTYAELSKFYEVPSATEDGNTVWRRIEAVTKHPVINEDGTNTMLKVTTKGNREIIASKAKSFLQLIDGKIQGVNGSDLKVGDYLPVSKVTYALSVSGGFIQDVYTMEHSDSIPNIIAGELVMEPRDGRCPDLEFDKIVSIEEVPNTTDYAYDLTVEDTRNFDCANGINLLDTFHTAGVASKSNVTRGVPRIEEILRLTKNPKHPSMTVFLKSADESNPEKAKQFANMMEHTTLGDVITSVQICFDPDEFNTRITEDRRLVQQFYEFSRMIEECNGGAPLTEQPTSKSKWIVRMEMDTETLLDKNITMDDIHFAIKNGTSGTDIDCAYSDYNSDKLVFRIRMSNIASAKKRKGSAEPLDQTDEIHILKKFQDDLLNNTVLRGVDGIANVLPRKLNNMVAKVDGKYEKKDTWVLDTTGSNLLETLGLDYIDSVRTHSNDIREMFDVLGIEAARQVIHDEIVDVLEFSGAYANYHHLSLLCDRMTTKKDLVSIFRTGLFSDDIGPIAKATFEVHTEVLLDAARFGEADNMRGVSANVMCGQPGYYGTNAFQLVLDMNEMSKLTVSQVTQQIDPMEELMGKPIEDSDVCPRSKIEIRNNIGSMKHADPGLCDDNYNAGF